jgi:hypothetical protein
MVMKLGKIEEYANWYKRIVWTDSIILLDGKHIPQERLRKATHNWLCQLGKMSATGREKYMQNKMKISDQNCGIASDYRLCTQIQRYDSYTQSNKRKIYKIKQIKNLQEYYIHKYRSQERFTK